MKRLILSLIFIISIILIFIFVRNKKTSVSVSPSIQTLETTTKVGDGPQEKIPKIEEIPDECEKYKTKLSNSKFENIQNRRWSNLHIKHIDGEVYRIRYFYDDGPNGEYKKTVLYKEDEAEFPHIVKTFRGFETESLKDYLEKGEVIWQEQAYEASYEGKSVYWRKINDEFVDLNVDEGLSCL